MPLDVDRLIYTLIDIYRSIVDIEKDINKGNVFKRISNRRKCKRYRKFLNDIIDYLPKSSIILTTNSITEFVSYILYTSNLSGFGSITNIIIKSVSNVRNIYLLTVSSGDYFFNIKLDLDNTNMDINIKLSESGGDLSGNTKVDRLIANDGKQSSFISSSIEYLNKVLLTDISNYVRSYIDKGE